MTRWPSRKRRAALAIPPSCRHNFRKASPGGIGFSFSETVVAGGFCNVLLIVLIMFLLKGTPLGRTPYVGRAIGVLGLPLTYPARIYMIVTGQYGEFSIVQIAFLLFSNGLAWGLMVAGLVSFFKRKPARVVPRNGVQRRCRGWSRCSAAVTSGFPWPSVGRLCHRASPHTTRPQRGWRCPRPSGCRGRRRSARCDTAFRSGA